jgi:FdhE protein
MLLHERWPSDRLANVFRTVRQDKPAYAHICAFFEALFTLQEAARLACRPPAMAYDPHLGPFQQQAGLPLMQRERMPIDWAAAQDLFYRFCAMALETNEVLGSAARTMADRVGRNGSGLEACGPPLLGDDPLALESIAAEWHVKADVLAFFVYHSIWPSAAGHLEALKAHLPPDQNWQKGYCPFCGSRPLLSLLSSEGQASLVCSFCRHTWPVPRLLCPFCENRDPQTLGYLFCAAEEEYRVNTCQVCKGYLKSVDLRHLAHPLYPPLEAILTTHLDLQAQEEGYVDMAPNWFRI